MTTSDRTHDTPPGMPRWVKAFGLILVLLLLVLAGLHLTGHAPTHMAPAEMHSVQSR